MAMKEFRITIPFIFFFLVSFCIKVSSIYPWDESFDDRSEKLLQQIREKLQLDLVGDTILKDLDEVPNNELIIRNLEGIPFIAKVKVEDPNDLRTQFAYLYDEKQLSSKFDGLCTVLPLEYWNYEWCHRKIFTQFHLEQEGRKIVKSPDWSLGKYSRTLFVRGNGDVGNEKAPITKIVDYFVGGQICHENDHHRSVEVHIQCCDGLGIPNTIPSEAYFSGEKNGNSFPIATLARITEPELCSYQATVCSPLLCSNFDSDENSSQKKSSRSLTKASKNSFVEIMKAINSTCVARQEEWWTYELCFNKGARQVRFNLEQTVTAEGSVVQKQVLANQYILGLPPFHLYTNEELLLNCTHEVIHHSEKELYLRERDIVNTFGMVSPLFKKKGKEPNYLSLHFQDGTPCDLDNVNRSVIIEIYCGNTNTLVQIREDSTCKYRMKVELAAVCVLPGFAAKKDNITSIQLTPLFDPEKEDKEEAADSEQLVPLPTEQEEQVARTEEDGQQSQDQDQDQDQDQEMEFLSEAVVAVDSSSEMVAVSEEQEVNNQQEEPRSEPSDQSEAVQTRATEEVVPVTSSENEQVTTTDEPVHQMNEDPQQQTLPKDTITTTSHDIQEALEELRDSVEELKQELRNEINDGDSFHEDTLQEMVEDIVSEISSMIEEVNEVTSELDRLEEEASLGDYDEDEGYSIEEIPLDTPLPIIEDVYDDQEEVDETEEEEENHSPAQQSENHEEGEVIDQEEEGENNRTNNEEL